MPCQETIELPSLAETQTLGRRLGQTAIPGDVITLSGDLGAGKTTLTQAIGQGIEVPDSCYITSPTFALIHEYPARIPLYHIDLYRLADQEETETLGLEDYIYGEGLTVIEWPDRLGDLMPENYLGIELIFTGENARTVILTAHHKTWEARIKAILRG
ncbi:MAG: tRNA (adenosine(37)-N6)-threonylcarbamoyltransferase complex ATPase subunit type 1 TsaE [Proteobacteria bacterium]|nr:tRNA (adenosine(37)-N6)-threonylcarbamoyltransferase complex ATPase subunit type 1 TsaE [Pseudomonadota bacterium]MBU1716091.1 tRNA (adenosine(37)-N6)-threonylcarbamoyltransferase complex ATPase subunit type 1 TsaE [Pseudomonadota bacterium]